MSDSSPSRTAIGVAYLRAAHQIHEADALVLRDPVALRILGPRAEAEIRAAGARLTAEVARALRAHVVLRSRVAEDRLAASLSRGIGQYVLVGAGYDTFALRQPEFAPALRIVEVDRAETQARKRAAVHAAGLREPDNLHYVAVDFERESLCEGLARAQVALDVPTFFSWLGVTMYLSPGAIDETLHCMASFPTRSEAVVTFFQPKDGATSALASMAATVGEPFISRITPEEFDAKLRGAGFGEVSMLTPELAAGYFLKAGSLPAPRRTSIAMAIV
ncbi:MAG: class I SAM-dependent methyltransferase [Gemmatimonadota bacterium]